MQLLAVSSTSRWDGYFASVGRLPKFNSQQNKTDDDLEKKKAKIIAQLIFENFNSNFYVSLIFSFLTSSFSLFFQTKNRKSRIKHYFLFFIKYKTKKLISYYRNISI